MSNSAIVTIIIRIRHENETAKSNEANAKQQIITVGEIASGGKDDPAIPLSPINNPQKQRNSIMANDDGIGMSILKGLGNALVKGIKYAADPENQERWQKNAERQLRDADRRAERDLNSNDLDRMCRGAEHMAKSAEMHERLEKNRERLEQYKARVEKNRRNSKG